MTGPPGYDIHDLLGRGGMGVVYRARDVRLNRDVALKMLLGGLLPGPVTRVRFLVEAEAVAQLEHPHVVQVYEFGEHDGQPFLALEYVQRRDAVGRPLTGRRAVRPGEPRRSWSPGWPTPWPPPTPRGSSTGT